jgi:hypothetical protein
MSNCVELKNIISNSATAITSLDNRLEATILELRQAKLDIIRLNKAIAFLERPGDNQQSAVLGKKVDRLEQLFSKLKSEGGTGLTAVAVLGMIGTQVNPLKLKLGETTATLGDVRKMAKRLDSILGNQTETVKVLDKQWREADKRLGGSERMQDRLQKMVGKQRYELNQLDKTAKKAVEQSKKGAEALKVANKNKGLIDKVSQAVNKSKGLIDKVSKVADGAKRVGEGAAKGVKGLSFVKPLAPWIGALVNLAGLALTAVTFFATLELTGRQLNNFDEAIAQNDAIIIKQGSLILQLKGRLNTQQGQIDKIRKENQAFDQSLWGLKQTINRTDKEVTKQNGVIQKIRETVDKFKERLNSLLDYLDHLQAYANRIDIRYNGETSRLKSQLAGTDAQVKKAGDTAQEAWNMIRGLRAFNREATSAINTLKQGLGSISATVSQQASAIPQMRSRLGNLEGVATSLKGQITGLEAKGNLTAQLAQQALTRPGTPGRQGQPGRDGQPGKDGKPGQPGKDADNARLRQVETELLTIAGATAVAATAIGSVNALKNRIGTVERLSTNVQSQQEQLKRQLEKELKQMPCKYSPALDTEIAANQQRTNGLVIRSMAVMDTINTVGIKRLQTTANTINTKLGKQLTGGVGGFLEGLWSSLRLGMVFQAISTWITLHNAIMLSSDIVQTLFSGIDSLIQVMGIQNPDKSAINVSEVLGKKVEELLKGMMGAANYEATKVKWNQLNRIYQATTNMLDAVTNMFSSLWNILETTGRYVSKIGNALMRAGAVMDNAYSWMDEQISVRGGRAGKLQEFVKGLEVTQDAVSSFSTITGEMVNIKENIEQLKTSKKEFDDATTSASGGVGKVEAASAAESLSASITNSDILESIPTE